MSGHAHHHDHHHHGAELPLSVMGQSAFVRVGAVAAMLALLWLAVLWAVSLP